MRMWREIAQKTERKNSVHFKVLLKFEISKSYHGTQRTLRLHTCFLHISICVVFHGKRNSSPNETHNAIKIARTCNISDKVFRVWCIAFWWIIFTNYIVKIENSKIKYLFEAAFKKTGIGLLLESINETKQSRQSASASSQYIDKNHFGY